MSGNVTMPCQVQILDGSGATAGHETTRQHDEKRQEAPTGRAVAEKNGTRFQNGRPAWAKDFDKLHHDHAPQNQPDAAATPAANAARQFVEAQKERRKPSCSRWMGKMRERGASMFTLNARNSTPAMRLTTPDWTSEAADRIVHTLGWELQHRDPAHIDPVELAHAVACVERWRSTGKPREARDEAIDAWLKAFSLHEAIDLDAIKRGYAAGATGYDHVKKSTWASHSAQLATYAMLAGPESMVAAQLTRTAFSLTQAYCNLTAGVDRARFSPQEDLAALLAVDEPERAAETPGMGEAASLARGLHKTPAHVSKLRAALDMAGDENEAQIKQALQEAEKLFALEDKVKARLNISAETWAGKARELPVRAAANTIATAGAVVSVAVPGGVATLPLFIGASAAVHSTYRLAGWDEKDARDRLMLRLFNCIKSYSWVSRLQMRPEKIARLYRDFEAGTMSRESLEKALAGVFDLPQVGKSVRLPVERRLDIAERLLHGKLAEAMDAELTRRDKSGAGGKAMDDRTRGSFRARLARACGLPSRHKDDDDSGRLEVRRLLADLFNLKRALELVQESAQWDAQEDNDKREAALEKASGFLHAVRDEEVRQLFTGGMRAQSAAAARALRLTKGEEDKFLYSLGTSFLPGSVLGPLAGTASGMETAFGTGDEAVRATNAAANFTGGFTHALSTSLLAGQAYQRSRENLEPDAAQITVPFDIVAADKPIPAEELSLDDVSTLLDKGHVPGTLELMWSGKEHTGKLTCELTETEPYYFEQRRKHGFAQRTGFFWKKVAAGAADALESTSEPFMRQVVTYHTRKTRAHRRELHALVDQVYEKEGMVKQERNAMAV